MSTATSADRPLVLVTETLDEACTAWLSQRANVVFCPYDGNEFAGLLPDAAGLVVRTYTQVNPDLLSKAPNLKVVGRGGVGLENIDVPACRERGVEVVYTPDANTQAVVEYVYALILDAVRPRYDITSHLSADQFHHVRNEHVGRQLDQLSLGIIGFGRIGKRLGNVAHALGINLKVNDILPESDLRKAVDYPFEFASLEKLCAESDVVTIHVDGREANRKMFGASVLSHLKPTTLLINAARGMLVDNIALRDWARTNPSARVVLDVHDPEPLPEDYVLHNLPNVRLLPHLASRTHVAMQNMSWVVRDVWAVLDGREPEYPAG